MGELLQKMSALNGGGFPLFYRLMDLDFASTHPRFLSVINKKKRNTSMMYSAQWGQKSRF